ncbi:MAG: MOSC domain-containing protein [Vicinamibacteria bacterium]
METGKLEAIWLKRMKLGPMDPHQNATLKAGSGLVDNANQGGNRQVTLMDTERWARIEETIGCSLDPSARRANLLVSGVSLAESRGRILKVGSCRLRLVGETRPCERMDEAFDGLRKVMQEDWGGGAYAEVLDDGKIAVGDEVNWTG